MSATPLQFESLPTSLHDPLPLNAAQVAFPANYRYLRVIPFRDASSNVFPIQLRSNIALRGQRCIVSADHRVNNRKDYAKDACLPF